MYYIYTFTLVVDVCASVCSFLDLTRLVTVAEFLTVILHVHVYQG